MKRRQLWGGRFAEGPAEVLRRFNDSFAFDRELLSVDVEGSVAWAEELGRSGVLRPAEARAIARGLHAVREEWAAGGARAADAAVAAGHEDVHSYVEAALAEKLGPLAGKLHTGRSRNDQVATDVRLYLKGALAELEAGALELAGVLAVRAADEAATPMPGYTHLKRAEPVTFGHWALAYAEMLLRDAGRARDAAERADECPLGSGALSGTPLPVDRARLAASLGFARPTANSLDAVSDRDAAAEYLFAAGLLLVHLSRLAEDLIFFTSDEVRFADLPDRLATGSSRMPHKKNPDVLELVRGHAGRAVGELAGLLALLKGIPLAYDKDLQLDKEPLFRTRATLAAAVPALSALLAGLTLHRERMRAAASDDALLATELADALARRGVPFREAHDVVGRRIAAAEEAKASLAGLGPGDGVTSADLRALDVDQALARRAAVGGTSPRRVRAAARAVLRRIERQRRQRRRTGRRRRP